MRVRRASVQDAPVRRQARISVPSVSHAAARSACACPCVNRLNLRRLTAHALIFLGRHLLARACDLCIHVGISALPCQQNGPNTKVAGDRRLTCTRLAYQIDHLALELFGKQPSFTCHVTFTKPLDISLAEKGAGREGNSWWMCACYSIMKRSGSRVAQIS